MRCNNETKQQETVCSLCWKIKKKKWMKCTWSSLERLIEADGGGAVEDDVDAGGELLHILWADGQARLRQLAADWDDLLVEIGVFLPHTVEKLPDKTEITKGKTFMS